VVSFGVETTVGVGISNLLLSNGDTLNKTKWKLFPSVS
jgi:hypothetical protein